MNRDRFLTLLKIAVAVALLLFLTMSGRLDFQRISELADISFIPYLIAIIALLLTAHSLMALRQRMLLERLDKSISWRRSLSIVMTGVFFNNTLPGWSGGDLIRVYYLRKETKLSAFELAGALLIDRMLGLCGLAFIAILSAITLGFLGLIKADFGLSVEKWAIVLLTLGFPILVTGLILVFRFDKVSEFAISFLEKHTPWDNAHKFAVALQLYSRRRRLLLKALIISIFMHASAILGLAILTYYLFDIESARSALFLSPIVFIASVIPVTPGNIGWTEVVAEGVLALFSQQGGATIFASWRIIVILFSMGGLYCYLKAGGPIKDSKSVS